MTKYIFTRDDVKFLIIENYTLEINIWNPSKIAAMAIEAFNQENVFTEDATFAMWRMIQNNSSSMINWGKSNNAVKRTYLRRRLMTLIHLWWSLWLRWMKITSKISCRLLIMVSQVNLNWKSHRLQGLLFIKRIIGKGIVVRINCMDPRLVSRKIRSNLIFSETPPIETNIQVIKMRSNTQRESLKSTRICRLQHF